MHRFLVACPFLWIAYGGIRTSSSTTTTCLALSTTSDFSRPSRRQVLVTSTAALGTGLLLPEPAVAQSFDCYKVVSDRQDLNPSLRPLSVESLIATLAESSSAVWLGEHHSSYADHQLQLSILQRLADQRPKLAIGLEQVQLQFQPVLDQYVQGTLSLAQLREKIEWDTRWMWDFGLYAPIFEFARANRVPLVALNVDSEDLRLVERNGLPGLSPQAISKYIQDAPGFAQFSATDGFRSYVRYVIEPSYDMHQQLGLLQTTMTGQTLDTPMSFKNFLSARILWDEAMASAANQFVAKNPGCLLVGLVGADHIKFQNGIAGRFNRMASSQTGGSSILLNPTPLDSRPSRTVVSARESISSDDPNLLTLQLRDGSGEVAPLADYIVTG